MFSIKLDKAGLAKKITLCFVFGFRYALDEELWCLPIIRHCWQSKGGIERRIDKGIDGGIEWTER
jgi:hypothetical protein